MNYIIFDNEIYYATLEKKGQQKKEEIKDVFTGNDKEVRVAIIDTLQKILPAPEKETTKRDEILADAFPGDYVTQAERVGSNMYQVVAVEKNKLSEIYKYFAMEDVKLVVPYALALREFLRKNNFFSADKRVIFLDHIGNFVLLTIFNKEAYTTPRRLSTAMTRVVSEMRRSQENYRALEKDEKGVKFTVLTNDQEIVNEINAAKADERAEVAYINEQYPALSGLKEGVFNIHFILPEQFLKIKKLQMVKKRFLSFGFLAGGMAICLVGFMACNFFRKDAQTNLLHAQIEKDKAVEKVKTLYAKKYKDILNKESKIDFPRIFNAFLISIPKGYKVERFSFAKHNDLGWKFEAVVYLEDKDMLFSPLSLPKIFNGAIREKVVVRDNPGERIVLIIPFNRDKQE